MGIYAGLSQSEWGRDLVVWPEAAIPLFQDEASDHINALAKQANADGSAWITGIMYRKTPSDASNQAEFYNSVMLYDANQVSVYKNNSLYHLANMYHLAVCWIFYQGLRVSLA